MKKPLSKITLFFMLSLIFGMAHGENTVDITSHNDGDNVGAQVVIEGTSNIEDDESNVWVLVHLRALKGQWWPQNESYRNSKTGDWEAVVYIGQKQDIGQKFEIAVATFNEKGKEKLLEYFERAERTGQYSPISFPDETETTSDVKIITVTKISH